MLNLVSSFNESYLGQYLEKKVMINECKENEIIIVAEKVNLNRNQDYEFISNDPKENADNFDPKWALLRDLTTDEERYEAIRKRWGNSNIPDPSINLTFRHIDNSLGNPQTVSGTASIVPKNFEDISRSRSQNKKPKSRRRSRSCTRPYEDLICNLEQNYFVEYCYLMQKHKIELQEMLQYLSVQSMNAYFCYPQIMYNNSQNLQLQQKQQMYTLLSSQYQQIKNFLGQKFESLDVCKGYLDEVKAFFTFYQKLNDSEVTLQMTDEQYEHTKETERMYSMYDQFYGKPL